MSPEPNKRPKSSYIRFAAQRPSECWQSDFTHYPFATGAGTEILAWLDDHSRLALSLTARDRVTGPIVVAAFRAAVAAHGTPASTLTDKRDGVHHPVPRRPRRPRRPRARATAPRRHPEERAARPPADPGKVERFWQTLKKHLAAQPAQPATLGDLPALLETFAREYNQRRPHKSLPHRATPAGACAARPKAAPGDRGTDTHDWVRTDKIGPTGKVTQLGALLAFAKHALGMRTEICTNGYRIARKLERDTIIDRVIAGMERKAAAGKWKGGRRPFGYQVDTAASSLVRDPGEATVVRLIFDLYTRERLGARAIANTLNERGQRTTAAGRWSAHQVLRVLSNRVYLGELAFRGITASGCHPPIIDEMLFGAAQRILTARGQDHAKRAANGSDYLLTGLIRCPACASAMLGTRAHGKSRIYRYYSCYRRTRYDTTACGGQRIDADAIENAVIGALTGFYRDQHDLMADAITAAQASRAAGHQARLAELATTDRELARTGAAIDRYLAAFENGTLDPEDLAGRLAQLKARSRQLIARRDELANQLDAEPAMPSATTLREVTEHIDQVIGSGSHNQRKALIEALVAQVKITGPGRIVPVFRIPQATGTGRADGSGEISGVRAMANLVEVAGIEPASFSTSPGLLRAQPALLFSAPAVTQASRRQAQSLFDVPTSPATGLGGESS